MDLLFGFGPIQPIQNPLIETAIQTETNIVEQIETPPLTWEDNPQGCNEATHWIAAEEPFYCIPKQVSTQARTTNTRAVRGSSAPSGWYPYGQCTYHVWTQRPVGRWNNATDWYWQAQRDGYATGTTPRVGAIAWQYGHVAYVAAVDGSRVYITEMNHDNRGGYRESWQPASKYKYIY
jgi:surface antigen